MPSPADPALPSSFTLERALINDITFLATDMSGRRVVLKKLDEDCLLRDRLHPVVKDRLERIRQLAHVGVANLLSVERHNGHPFLVWEFVEGTTLEELFNTPPGPANPRAIALELIRSVDALHALGIVHGSLHPRNVVIGRTEQIRLTHISPLLYDDPTVDIEALFEILPRLGVNLPVPPPPALRQLATALASSAPAVAAGDSPSRLDRRAIFTAILIALIAVAGAVAIYILGRGRT